MSHEDDNTFANNPIEESLNPSVDKEKKRNKFLDKLKILDHRKTEVRTLSESDKRHLTSKCFCGTSTNSRRPPTLNKLSCYPTL